MFSENTGFYESKTPTNQRLNENDRFMNENDRKRLKDDRKRCIIWV